MGQRFTNNVFERNVFKKRLAFPKYTVTYDLWSVLDFTKSLGSSTETVLEISIIPLATLLCLLNRRRELYLKIDSMYIAKSLKSKRTGFQWHPLEFVVYPIDKNSCAV